MPDQVRSSAYRTLAASLRDAIRNGEYADGQQLPTEEQLAARHSVSRQTVRRAMQDLVSEGIIYRVAGRGTYPVAEADRYLRHFGSVEDLMALSLDTDCEIVSTLRHVVDVEGAGQAEAALRRCAHAHADPAARERAVLLHLSGPATAGRGTDGDVPELAAARPRSQVTVIGLIDTRMARSIKGAEQSITAAAAPPSAADHLECAPGQPVLRDRPAVHRRRGHPGRAGGELLRSRTTPTGSGSAGAHPERGRPGPPG